MANWGQSSREWQDPEANKLPEKVEELEKKDEIPEKDEVSKRKKIVVVGLGMVGISFMYALKPPSIKTITSNKITARRS